MMLIYWEIDSLGGNGSTRGPGEGGRKGDRKGGRKGGCRRVRRRGEKWETVCSPRRVKQVK
jgi:hypothetical protein